MPQSAEIHLISRRYRDVFGAALAPSFIAYMGKDTQSGTGAALGYRRANETPLFLETYLDQPIEALVSDRLGRTIARSQIVEIGNFAADNALAMIDLWGAAANDLGGASEIAVATLTAPLRRMFARIGLPLTMLAPAIPARLGQGAGAWGSYFDLDPQICMGVIAEGQRALATFLARRNRQDAA